MAKTAKYAFGVAKAGDNPNGPKVKGWVKLEDNMKLEPGVFYDFALWPSRTEKGAYNIEIKEQWKKPDDYAQGSVDAVSAKQLREELDDEIPF